MRIGYAAGNLHTESDDVFRFRSVRDWRRLRRRARCAFRRRFRRARGGRGKPLPGRHLRERGLRAEEAAGLRSALPRGLRAVRRLRLERRQAYVRLADPDRQQEPRNPAPQRRLPQSAGEQRGDPAGRPCAHLRCAHGRGRRPALPHRQHPHRHRRLAADSGHSRQGTCDHLQRGVLPRTAAAPRAGGRRWLHRRGIRLDLPWPGRADHPAVSPRSVPARFRPQRARAPARRAGQEGHEPAVQQRHRTHRQAGRWHAGRHPQGWPGAGGRLCVLRHRAPADAGQPGAGERLGRSG
ncbi:hypothetical protein D3C78_1066540 [compost metagenome]